MGTDSISIRVSQLTTFTEAVFRHLGVSAVHAKQAAEILSAADLRGIDSHGVARLPRYAELLASGHLNPAPHITIVRSSDTTATVDGDGGLGLIVGPVANEMAMEMASMSGAGWVAVRNSSHYGIAGYYAKRAAEMDMIGWSMTNAGNLVAPFGGAERMLGTNPIAVAFPAGKESPVVVDMATSAVAYGKIQIAKRENKPLPPGWAIKADGLQAEQPEDMIDGGALLPLGSNVEGQGHKGYCMSAMVDMLCGVLSGAGWGPFGPHFAMATSSAVATRGIGTGHFFGALRIDGFIDPSKFKNQLDDWIQTMRATAPMPGTEGPLIPGDPERQCEEVRSKTGIPLLPPVVAKLESLAEKTGVPLIL